MPTKHELLPTTSTRSSTNGGGSTSPSRRAARPIRSSCRPLAVAIAACVSVLLLIAYWQQQQQQGPQEQQRIQSHGDFRSASANHPEKKKIIQQFDVSSYVIDNLERVNVTLVYAPDSSVDGDWIGVYCLEKDHQQVPLDDYLDRRELQNDRIHVIPFGPLVNMRCSLQFKLIASHGTTLATAPSLLRFRKGHGEPTQVHLAMTETAKEMRVMWTSGAVAGQPRVRYGVRADALHTQAIATWTLYDADDMCGPPATIRGPREFRDPGRMYDAVMVELEVGVVYYYQVGSGDTWSDVFHFQLPPLKGQEPREPNPQSIFVFGDLMTATSATRDFRIPGSCGTTMELIEKDLLDREFVGLFHVGDLSYAAGKGYVWDHFGSLISPVASQTPYMVSIGNHDFGYLEGRHSKPERAPRHQVFEADGTHGHDAYGECGVPSEKRFQMPANGNGIWWYSVDIGLTHHTVLSGEHDFSIGSAMHTWMRHDLENVDRTKTPWLVVHLHRPLYCSVAFGGDFTRSLLLRDHLEKVFAEFRVDVVFSGHYHSYERTCPVYDDACQYGAQGQALAPVHIMVGSGGANVDTFGYYSASWSEYARMTYGYGRFHVFNASHALFEFVSNEEKRVTDEMWIVSDHKWSHDGKWRWRRWVFHPSLAFVISMAVLSVVGITAKIVWTRRRDPKRQYHHHKADKHHRSNKHT